MNNLQFAVHRVIDKICSLRILKCIQKRMELPLTRVTPVCSRVYKTLQVMCETNSPFAFTHQNNTHIHIEFYLKEMFRSERKSLVPLKIYCLARSVHCRQCGSGEIRKRCEGYEKSNKLNSGNKCGGDVWILRKNIAFYRLPIVYFTYLSVVLVSATGRFTASM